MYINCKTMYEEEPNATLSMVTKYSQHWSSAGACERSRQIESYAGKWKGMYGHMNEWIRISADEFHFHLQWRHNEYDGVSIHRRLHCLRNCWFRRRSKKTSKLRVTGLCEGKSPVTGEFLAQKASNAENVSIWWRHHVILHAHCMPGNPPDTG